MKVVLAKQMQELDQKTINSGVPGRILMERAGRGAFQEILLFVRNFSARHVQHFIILAGKGNNGGDGYVIARLLAEETQYKVSVHSVCSIEKLQGDALLNAVRLPSKVNFYVSEKLPDDCFCEGTIFIDSLLGTGISGAIRKPYAAIIRQVNSHALPIISIDIPSGIDADDGSGGNPAIQADLTINMGLPKKGLFLNQGQESSGRLRLVDIGIPRRFVDKVESPFDAILCQDITPFFDRLPKTVHKAQLGKILVIGGSEKYPGAPLLTGCGALRSGGGLVTVAYPKSISSMIHPKENALILNPVEDNGSGCHRILESGEFDGLIQDKDTIVVGPGLTRDNNALSLVGQLLSTEKRVILDADGLNVFTMDQTILPRKGVTVLTPHAGEIKRLMTALNMTDLLSENRTTQARTLATKLGAFIILKGPYTVIADPKGGVAVNTSGCPGLATGGTGDVLAGMIAAFSCQFQTMLTALKSAVFVHGLAAEMAINGMRNFIADDLLAYIGLALKEVSPFA